LLANGPAPATTSADYDSFLDAVGVVAAERPDLDLTGSLLTFTGTVPSASIEGETVGIDAVSGTDGDSVSPNPDNGSFVVGSGDEASFGDIDVDVSGKPDIRCSWLIR